MIYLLVSLNLIKILLFKQHQTSQNGLKVAKAGHKSEGCMGMIANSYDSEKGGMVTDWHNGEGAEIWLIGTILRG